MPMTYSKTVYTKEVCVLSGVLFLSVCYQLHDKTTDHILVKISPEMYFGQRTSHWTLEVIRRIPGLWIPSPYSDRICLGGGRRPPSAVVERRCWNLEGTSPSVNERLSYRTGCVRVRPERSMPAWVQRTAAAAAAGRPRQRDRRRRRRSARQRRGPLRHDLAYVDRRFAVARRLYRVEQIGPTLHRSTRYRFSLIWFVCMRVCNRFNITHLPRYFSFLSVVFSVFAQTQRHTWADGGH